ncbi:ATPase with chaperone activity [Aquariibacter albus]|uniref:ATPase with chaperone activity n=1 Tax=Aquariibacter albus TaxID=2759899 RepID=A0A839HGA8_9BURK|nr:ATPase with chaperone activity [Aquariibacter albus]MBB1161045.1 ATPase with chaperone activity [Aquariibacter albus]
MHTLPPSFLALHPSPPRGWRAPELAALSERHEFCEDLAQSLAESCRGLPGALGVTADDVLARCHRGLAGPEAGVSPAESVWVLRRLAELLGWRDPGDWLDPAAR